jgi:hypothetical protein
MRFDCGKTSWEKHQARKEWHKWFAWYPVRISSHDCRWLETVRRKGTYECSFGDCYWDWEYEVMP